MEKKTYFEKLKDPRWQKMRLRVLERDNWTCRSCRDKDTTLTVHHRYYERGKEPWDYPMEALVTLCELCHKKEGKHREEIENWLWEILKKHCLELDLFSLYEGIRRCLEVETIPIAHLCLALQSPKAAEHLGQMYKEVVEERRAHKKGRGK